MQNFGMPLPVAMPCRDERLAGRDRHHRRALEALNLSLQAVTEPGDWVVVENPCFYGALQALERLRLSIVGGH